MNSIIKKVFIFLVVVLVVLVGIYGWNALMTKKLSPFVGNGGSSCGSVSTIYVPAGTTSTLIKPGAFRLAGVTIGQDVASGSVALYDTTDSALQEATPNEVALFTGSTLHGFYPINVDISTGGLMADVTTQTGTIIDWCNP